jgi:hypothetical protein
MSEHNTSEADYRSASHSLYTLLSYLFSHLHPEEVEQFYQGYHAWLLHQRLETLRTRIAHVREQINENEQRMLQVSPSAIALAAIARLQSSGVHDIDLLDRLLERGEDWLDKTMLLLNHCERLGVIDGDYTQWCENALEGAYNWLASIKDTDALTSEASESVYTAPATTTPKVHEAPDKAASNTSTPAHSTNASGPLHNQHKPLKEQIARHTLSEASSSTSASD